MPADATIHLRAENQTQQAFRETEQALRGLESQARDVQQASRITAQAFDHMGDEAGEAAVGVTALGRSIFRTQEQAKRFNGVWRSLLMADSERQTADSSVDARLLTGLLALSVVQVGVLAS